MALVAEEQPLDISSEEVGQTPTGAHLFEVPSMVLLTAMTSQEESETSSPLHISSAFEFPLFMLLPDFFFALGPWRCPEEQLRSGCLHIDMVFLVDGTSWPSFVCALCRWCVLCTLVVRLL